MNNQFQNDALSAISSQLKILSFAIDGIYATVDNYGPGQANKDVAEYANNLPTRTVLMEASRELERIAEALTELTEPK